MPSLIVLGTSKDVIIPLLQEIQDEFSYLPSDALERIYERTEIDRAQLISVSTFLFSIQTYSLWQTPDKGLHRHCLSCKREPPMYMIPFKRETKNGRRTILLQMISCFSIEKVALSWLLYFGSGSSN